MDSDAILVARYEFRRMPKEPERRDMRPSLANPR
jgi:hypothetical protein